MVPLPPANSKDVAFTGTAKSHESEIASTVMKNTASKLCAIVLFFIVIDLLEGLIIKIAWSKPRKRRSLTLM